ncbi:dihydroneopterin aldolase [Megasphaera paucivorans]|uniref:7,8-dihydroneopterin aldolase n=2 Tax=Megasphaera paucivorans TaxID=349095 RepID=A0A1G9PZB0_9FIRM|nr:dihydroneopterin aldolase [Megasphaera paucivorans]
MEMDKIILKGMHFYGYHGCFPEEQRTGQPFSIDIMMTVDLTKAGYTDALSDTVDYGAVYDCIKKIVEGKPCNLIEKVACIIADTILDVFSPNQVQVTVHKPHAPIGGSFDDVAVVIERSKNCD